MNTSSPKIVELYKSVLYKDVLHASAMVKAFFIAEFLLVVYTAQIILPFGIGWTAAICIPLAAIALTPISPVVGMGAFVFLAHGLPRYDDALADIQELIPLYSIAAIAIFFGWILGRRKDDPLFIWSKPGYVACTLFAAWLVVCFWVGYINNYQWTFTEFSRHHPINHLSGFGLFLMATHLLGNKDSTYTLAAIFICSLLLGALANPGEIYLNGDLGAMVPIALPLAFLLFKLGKNRPEKILWIFAILGLVILLMLTRNRAGLIGLGIAAVLSILVISRNKMIAVFAVIVAGLLLLATIPSDYIDRFSVLWNPDASHATAKLDRANIEGRLTLWQCSMDFVREEPIWGVGTGNFPKVIHQCDPGMDRLVAHNNFVSIAVEAGLIGLGLYMALLISVYYHGLRRRRNAYDWITLSKGLLLASFSAYLAVSFFVSRHDMVFAYILMGWIISLDLQRSQSPVDR